MTKLLFLMLAVCLTACGGGDPEPANVPCNPGLVRNVYGECVVVILDAPADRRRVKIPTPPAPGASAV